MIEISIRFYISVGVFLTGYTLGVFEYSIRAHGFTRRHAVLLILALFFWPIFFFWGYHE